MPEDRNSPSLVEIEREPDHLLDAEPCAGDVGGRAVDAINAVIDAEIGQQDLEQADAAPVRRIGMADAAALGRTDATRSDAVAFFRA